MRKSVSFLFVFAFSSVMSLSLLAADKEVKLEGKGQCAKCSLGVADKCQNVLVLKKDGKDVTYYLDGAKSKAFHKNLCQGVHTTKVEGKLSEKDGKSIIDVTAIELVK